MANNPFRAKPNLSVQQNIEDWGKKKFKPNTFGGKERSKNNFKNHGGGGSNKPFGKKFQNHKGNFKKDKDVSRFNQVDRNARPENATPWNKFKDGIVFQQREDEQTAQWAKMDNKEGNKILKQREISYRKLLIEQKKQEPTQWDDFGEEENNNKNEKKNNSSNPKNNESNSKTKKKFKKINANIDLEGANNELYQKSIPKFKNRNDSPLAIKADVKEIISKELLDNFDSKKLSFKQNDELRGLITKTTSLCRRNNLKLIVRDMKYQKQKKEKKEKKLNKKKLQT